MSLLGVVSTGDSVRFDREECLQLGRRFHAQYTQAKPYAHVVLDDFLPVDLLERVVDEFPKRQSGRFSDAHSNLKTGYQLDMIQSHFITDFLYALNSATFLCFLEELTGIKGLISDPYYSGGGLHETARGGHLSIHADFNMHPMYALRRRLNVILFLNENWKEEYGGHLELWNKDMHTVAERLLPVMGRAVIFNTDEDSFHGHPDPLNSPETIYRRSMALYYYTIPTASSLVNRHTTRFKARPGSNDKSAYQTALRELVRDLCPPLLLRMLRRG